MFRNSTSVVLLTQSSGVELNVRLILDEKPTRMHQKLKTLSQYVQRYPSGWKKRLELANLLYAMGCIHQAIEEYRFVVDRQPQLLEVRMKLGKLLQITGKEALAIAVYESALLNVRHVATRKHIDGLIAVCRNDIQGAIAAFEAAAVYEPDNAAHWLALGQLHMQTEDTVAALQAFNAVLSLNPDDMVALIDSYDLLLATGNMQAAQQRLGKIVDLAGDDFQTLKRQIDQRYRQRLVSGDEGKQTQQMLNSLVRMAAEGADVCQSLADDHIFRGEWAKGVGILAQFTEEHPNHPKGWYYYGRCLFHTGEYQKAASAMLKAYDLYPQDCQIYRALCEVLPAAGMIFYPNLVDIVEQMLQHFGDRWSVWATAGRVLVESCQEIARGCDISFKGTQLQPLLPDAWFCYGRVLALAGKHQSAVEALAQGWRLLPEAGGYMQSVSAAVWLGESYQVLGDDNASRRWWEEACQRVQELMEFEPAIASYWQGRALEGMGDVKGAIQAYGSALSLQLLYSEKVFMFEIDLRAHKLL